MPLIRPCRVTVINDSPDFVDAVRDALVDDGCVVTRFHTIDVGIDDLVASRPEILIVDLIPDWQQSTSGWEVMLLARSHPDLHSVPIILCSADVVALREYKDELAAIAGVEVLAKPFSLEELEAAINRRLLTPSR
jgi:DNA-binding response OmpR family regulator